MPGVLALIGGGELTESCASFDKELLQSSRGTEVVVLPTAAAFSNPTKLVARATEWFATLGATVREVPVLQRPAALDPANADIVRGARLIYFVGDSPLHLRSVLKETPLWEAVREAWGGGAVHYENEPTGPHEAGWLALDTSKAQAQLALQPRWSLEQTVQRSMRWYRAYKDGAAARALCLTDIEAWEAAV